MFKKQKKQQQPFGFEVGIFSAITMEQPQVILCDMCTETKRMPAQKTCMKCEISMCSNHLQAHLTTPVLLQTHLLTEPTVLCGTNKCPQHGKLLEYYCLDDMNCVCVSCAIEDQHRLHNMKTFPTAHKELVEKVKQDEEELKVKIKGKNTKHFIEQWEEMEEEKARSSSIRLIEAVKHLRELALASVQLSVSGRVAALKTCESSMQAAQNEKDTFRFLQMYKQVHQDLEKAKAVDLRFGLEPSRDRDVLVQQLRQGGESMLENGRQFWRSLLVLVDPENHQNLDGPYLNLIFQPITKSPMSLSRDRRKLFYSSNAGQSSVTLKITSWQSISDIKKWRVKFSKDCDWTTGLCDKQQLRNIDGLVYALSCDGEQLSTHVGQNGIKSSTPIAFQAERGEQEIQRPRLVEVELWTTFQTTSLSFYSRIGEQHREKICTLEMIPDVWKNMVPFVKIKKFRATAQQQLKCICGENMVLGKTQCLCGAQLYVTTTEEVCGLK